ncbi:MAG: hypothetical protein LE179_04905 [Endomicrobium sp.]|nr:hypothetical protein [Endomicrobium sp.]
MCIYLMSGCGKLLNNRSTVNTVVDNKGSADASTPTPTPTLPLPSTSNSSAFAE